MDKFIIREPRATEFPKQQENQMPGYFMHSENNITLPPPTPGSVYSGGYNVEAPINRSHSGYMSVSHMNVNSPYANSNATPGQGQMTSGIDPHYLNTYADSSAAYIAGTGQQQPPQRINDQRMPAFPEEPYQGRQFVGPDHERMRNVQAPYVQQSPQIGFGQEALQRPNREQGSMNKASYYSDYTTRSRNVIGFEHRSSSFTPQLPKDQAAGEQRENSKRVLSFELPQKVTNAPTQLPASFKAEMEPLKIEVQNPTKTRFEKLKALHNSGPRAFSGPVDKVLKWHKALQDIGLLVLYEIVAKCVSVRPGESCAKNLVVRDENGPAMQVVYYEIDFLLPELKPPCTVRVIGRMMPGTCRLQAFNVRIATGDDVATLPRRAAVAAHHVAKLCKEYGTHNV